MLWELWIGLTLIYVLIGISIMGLSYTQAKKRVVLLNEATGYSFQASWKTFILFPFSTVGEADTLLQLFKSGTFIIPLNEAPPAFKAINGERKTRYLYGTPFIWPFKLVWPILILLLCLIISLILVVRKI